MDQRLASVPLPEPEDIDSALDDKIYHGKRRRTKIKVLVVMLFAVVFGSLGDIALSNGMKSVVGMPYSGVFHAFVMTMTNPYVIVGILLQMTFLFLYLASLSWESLSFVLPLTAADYVLVTIFAHFLLHENVSPFRWAGSCLVAVGIAMVART